MTIDEAIAREKQQVKEQRSHIGTWDEEYSKKCELYAEEHEQLAEWLEELKMYKSLAPRELVSQKQKNDRVIEYTKGFDYGFKTGYNKAIDDFVKEIKEEIKADKNGFNSYYGVQCIDVLEVSKIAEHLKAGGVKCDAKIS